MDPAGPGRAIEASAALLGVPDQALTRAVVVSAQQDRRPVRVDELPQIRHALGITSVQLFSHGQDIATDVFDAVSAVLAPDRTADGTLVADKYLLVRIRKLFDAELDQRVDRAVQQQFAKVLARVASPDADQPT